MSIAPLVQAVLDTDQKLQPGAAVGRSHPRWKAVEALAAYIEELPGVGGHPHRYVSWSVGKGGAAKVSWIAITDDRETRSRREGLYARWAFPLGGGGFVLELTQGTSGPIKALGATAGRAALAKRAESARRSCRALAAAGFQLDGAPALGLKGAADKAKRAAEVAWRAYDAPPEDAALLADLRALLSAYERIVMGLGERATWIFQRREPLGDLLAEGARIPWPAGPSAGQLRAGDRVYIWHSGERPAIVADGRVAPEEDAEQGGELASRPRRSRRSRRRPSAEPTKDIQDTPAVLIDRLLRPISREQITRSPTLSELPVLRYTDAPQLAISAAQDRALRDLARRDAPEPPFELPAAVEALDAWIQSRGFLFEPWQIAAYVTALRTKPFAILAGVSGTGKSRLPALVAQATGGEARLVPVRPDWTDSAEVLGYADLGGQFRPGRLLQLARAAEDAPDRHFVCVLDEMNLARVEYYLAEILSQLEAREMRPPDERGRRRVRTHPLLTMDVAEEAARWASVGLPPNLAVVGTVNMDETTHGFSRKVLDRAFTMELSEIHLSRWGPAAKTGSAAPPPPWPVSAWLPRAFRLGELDPTPSERAAIERAVDELVAANRALIHAQAHVGYRSRDEIALFIANALPLREQLRSRDGTAVDALDLAFKMKLLPRLAGGSLGLRRAVLGLLGWACEGASIDEEGAAELCDRWAGAGRGPTLPGARFPRTAARLCLMWERLVADGFTSFWL